MTDVEDPVADPVAGPRHEPYLLPAAAVAIVVGGGLALAASASALDLLIAIAVVQALFAMSWTFGTGMPGRKGALVIAAMAAGAADVTVSVWPHGRLGTLVAVLGLAVPVMFVHQLARGAARTQLVSSLSAVALLVVVEVALPALVQLRHEFVGDPLAGRVAATAVATVAAALVVGQLVDLLAPVPRFDPEVPRGLLALIASAAVGAAVGYLLLGDRDGFESGRGGFLGAALGALAGLLAIATAFTLYNVPEPANRLGRVSRPVVAVLLPLGVLPPVAFLLCLAVRS